MSLSQDQQALTILNLGCGTKASRDPRVVNIDWSMYQRMRQNRALTRLAPLVLDGERLRRFRELGDNVVAHDLSKGIPFSDGSVDAVYHSHMLEHLDRGVVPGFFSEARRVLRPGGVHRIVVPDFELLARRYVAHLEACEAEPEEHLHHDEYIVPLIEQSVRKQAYSSGVKSRPRAFIEDIVLGDARGRGETHQWMYDRVSLGQRLLDTGFSAPTVCAFDESSIPGWNEIGLDLTSGGGQYKPDSLFMEATVPR